MKSSPLYSHLQGAFTAVATKKKEQRKSELLAVAKTWLAQEKAALKNEFIKTGDAQALISKHADVMDALLKNLFEEAGQEKTSSVLLLATGGYGRRELFPYSDIDIVFLYEAKAAKEAARIAEYVLYALWDLGLKVGQAHHSVDEAIAASISDMTIRTTFLDSHLVAGDGKLLERFWKRFEKEVIADSTPKFVEAKLVERDVRHTRFGDSRYMLEPNVKEGKGGLRDLHTLWWIVRHAYQIRSFKDMVRKNYLTQEEYDTFDSARQFLWKVRAHLHYLAGHAEERLSFDRQHALAVAMGYAHPSANQAITRFMRRYFVAVRMVGSLTRVFCALMEEENKRLRKKSLAWWWHNPWRLGAFKLDGERLNVRNTNAFEQQPVLMLELFRMAQVNDLDIHPRAIQLIARNLPRINQEVQNDPKANAIFLDILLSEKGAEATLKRMSDAGVLGKFIPDFGRVVGMTQFNMYHVYTVDEHTLVALGMLAAIEHGKMKETLPLASEIIHRVRMKRVLYVALLCHDIAKGRGGDHSLLGEKIAMRLSKRFGFDRDEIETTAWLVKNHLLFTNTVFKRDINDPKTVADFVAEVQTPERLKLLLVLTVADISAVAPGVWNAWKGALMRDLYRRADLAMGTGDSDVQPRQTEQLKSELVKLLLDWDDEEIEGYLALGNPSFWAGCDAQHHATIARMVRTADTLAFPLLIDTQHDYERSITELTLAAPDQHGLFSKIAGAVSLSGANIINAKIFTLKNGIAVEIFQVQDTAGDLFDRPDKLAKMTVNIRQVLEGELDLSQAFSKKQIRHSRAALHIPGQVLIDNDASNYHTVIEVTGRDRTGFLYQVTRAIAELGLTIVTAHVSTYGAQVADVFYVKDLFGMKITHDNKLKMIRETLLDVVEVSNPAFSSQKVS